MVLSLRDEEMADATRFKDLQADFKQLSEQVKQWNSSIDEKIMKMEHSTGTRLDRIAATIEALARARYPPSSHSLQPQGSTPALDHKSWVDKADEEVPKELSDSAASMSIDEKKKSPKVLDEPDDSSIQAVTAGDTPYTSASTFEDLNLSPELLNGLYVEMEFQKPSKIRAISLLMILNPAHKDLLAQAHNGSGKTTCFVLGMRSHVDPEVQAPEAHHEGIIHGLTFDPGISSSFETYNILFGVLLSRGRNAYINHEYIDTIRCMFKQTVNDEIQPDIFSLNSMIKGYVISLHFNDALRIYHQMGVVYACKPNSFTYDYLIHGLCAQGRTKNAKEICNETKTEGLTPSTKSYHSLVNALALGGEIKEAVKYLWDLSSNSLKGAIPSSIGRLTHLRLLNFSTNFFSGEIPDIGLLNTFGHKSFTGNLDLFGRQVDKPCRTSLGFPVVLPHAASDEATVPAPKRSSHYMKVLLIGAISALALAFVIMVSFLWTWMQSKQERAARRYKNIKKHFDPDSSTKLMTFHGDLPYPSATLVEKLDSLDEKDEVGPGGLGTVFRMDMNDSASFAIKRMDRNLVGSKYVFERNLEILGSVAHINFVNLRGYCKLPSSKFLIYDYLAVGSLDHLLHENDGEQFLNWTAHLKIALGSARGLAYLHHECSPKIVNSNIKSSNILLDENLEPRVSDFGHSKLLTDKDTNVTTVVAGTFGYMALEYLERGRAIMKSDVYSFGVLLLEPVTGKRPTDTYFVKQELLPFFRP